jgi:hypothetical protein
MVSVRGITMEVIPGAFKSKLLDPGACDPDGNGGSRASQEKSLWQRREEILGLN